MWKSLCAPAWLLAGAALRLLSVSASAEAGPATRRAVAATSAAIRRLRIRLPPTSMFPLGLMPRLQAWAPYPVSDYIRVSDFGEACPGPLRSARLGPANANRWAPPASG